MTEEPAMHTVSAFFPVARPREAAALLLASSATARSRVAEAVSLAFAIRDAGEHAFGLHLAPAAAPQTA
jgi:hypothetical protein